MHLLSSTGLLLFLMHSVPTYAGCYETTDQTISVSTIKEPTILFGGGVRGSKGKHGCDLLGASLGSVLGVSHDCSELQNLGNKGGSRRDPTVATRFAGLQTSFSRLQLRQPVMA